MRFHERKKERKKEMFSSISDCVKVNTASKRIYRTTDVEGLLKTVYYTRLTQIQDKFDRKQDFYVHLNLFLQDLIRTLYCFTMKFLSCLQNIKEQDTNCPVS